MTSPTVFISYSHKDEVCKDRLMSHLGVLQHEGLLDLWDDRRIDAGEDWKKEIEEAMAKANVAILLVSRHFLTSNFILEEEVPRLMERREKEGVRIFPIIAEPCAWKQVKWLSRINLRPKDGKPLSGGNKHQIDTDLAAIAEEVVAIIKRVPEDSSDKGHAHLAPEKISLARLPSTSSALFGRQKELEALDVAWADHKTNIVTLVAWGGVGKTALVNAWLNRMRDNHFGGAERVYGWSFYSQGTSEGKQISADVFIASALDWFGDSAPDKGSPWDKGERLADFIKKQKTLLILDGLEPLQNPPGEGEGRIKDPGLKSLLRELAHQNPGLCIINTRLEVDDIKDFIGNSAQSIPLDHLSLDSGKELLEHLGVKGEPDELKQASREFGCHALALTLLGSYLTVVHDGDVRKRDKIARLTDDEENGGHAKRVMESYEKWFKGKPELNILYIMGVLGRPAEGGAIKALMTKPVINGLTSDFKKLSSKNWRFALNRLRKVELLSNEDAFGSDKQDCHPLIREHFGEKLKENKPEAWKEAHSRLYDYYKNQAKEYPDTIEEMTPLYAAVAHGCQAGRYQEVFNEVYRERIQRKGRYFDLLSLGAFGADLATLSGFFDSPWDQPTVELSKAEKGLVLEIAGFNLRALGRLNDAMQPMQAGLKARIIQKDWKIAAIPACNLSELSLTTGDLVRSLEYAEQSVDLADRSSDAFWRMVSRTTLADAMHQAGRQSEAKSLFREAEELYKEEWPLSYISSTMGFEYCDLLLSQGMYQEVQSRAEHTVEVASTLLDIALDKLSLGKAYFLQAQQERTDDFTQAIEHLNQAVDGLRKAGQQQELPRGLLAHAELYRVQGAFEKAQRDLDEAMTIAKRGEMGLHQADCHLEYARLFLAMGKQEDKAQEHLVTAREMIGKMGYHRRDGELEDMEAML